MNAEVEALSARLAELLATRPEARGSSSLHVLPRRCTHPQRPQASADVAESLRALLDDVAASGAAEGEARATSRLHLTRASRLRTSAPHPRAPLFAPLSRARRARARRTSWFAAAST